MKRVCGIPRPQLEHLGAQGTDQVGIYHAHPSNHEAMILLNPSLAVVILLGHDELATLVVVFVVTETSGVSVHHKPQFDLEHLLRDSPSFSIGLSVSLADRLQ